MIKWIKFDRDNLPLDGHYPCRIEIPGRADNPGYNKIRIVNGQCHEHFLDIVTHYAVDNSPDIKWDMHEMIAQVNAKTDEILKLVKHGAPSREEMDRLRKEVDKLNLSNMFIGGAEGGPSAMDKLNLGQQGVHYPSQPVPNDLDTALRIIRNAGTVVSEPAVGIDYAKGEDFTSYSWRCPVCGEINHSVPYHKSPVDETLIVRCFHCEAVTPVEGDRDS